MVKAGLGDLAIGLGLLIEVGGRCVTVGVDGERDIEFGDVDLEAESGEAGDVGRDRGAVGRLLDVHLEPDAVDGNTLALEIAHHGVDGIGLFVAFVGFGFVVEEESFGVGFVGPAKGLGEISELRALSFEFRVVSCELRVDKFDI